MKEIIRESVLDVMDKNNIESAARPHQGERFIASLFKERWVNISIRYDDFWKFMYHYVLPNLHLLLENKIIASFYHRVVYSNRNIIQLTFYVSPFNLERHLKPRLLESLNQYYDGQYFQLSDLQITDDILTQKNQTDIFELDNFKLFGLEEYYVDEMTYVIGRLGAKVLQDFSCKSAAIALDRFQQSGEGNWTLEDSVENSLSLHCTVLHIFITDATEIYHFLSWVTASMFDSVKKLNGVVDTLEWKFNVLKGMDSNFESCKESFCGYIQYVLECLQTQSPFEEEWLNKWVSDCYECKNALAVLTGNGKIVYNNAVREDDTIFHDIDDVTYKKWQIVYSILRTVNRQMGISTNYYLEVDLFYSIKQSFKTFLHPAEIDTLI